MSQRTIIEEWVIKSQVKVMSHNVDESWMRLILIANESHDKVCDQGKRNKENVTVPISLCFSFDMGVHSPPSVTYTLPNHNSSLSFPEHILSHIQTEISLGHYSGLFSCSKLESLIGPFRTSPLGTVPKIVGSTDRRDIQDLSFPRDNPSRTSVNDQINIKDFRCHWGTFNKVRKMVIDALPFSEAATLDDDSAFRCCPITPSQQRNFIIHWNNLLYWPQCPIRCDECRRSFQQSCWRQVGYPRLKRFWPF